MRRDENSGMAEFIAPLECFCALVIFNVKLITAQRYFRPWHKIAEVLQKLVRPRSEMPEYRYRIPRGNGMKRP